MRPGLTFQVTPVKLVQSLKRDGAALLGTKLFGDFLPCLAALTLLADELHKRFEAAAIGTPTATPFIFGIRIHSWQFRPADDGCVSE